MHVLGNGSDRTPTVRPSLNAVRSSYLTSRLSLETCLVGVNMGVNRHVNQAHPSLSVGSSRTDAITFLVH
jgi:hypothetical protein